MEFVHDDATITTTDRSSGKLEKFQKKVQTVWKKTQDQALAKVGGYALKNFGKSKYARQSFNTLPTSIIAGLLKAIVNFLILYRLNTGNYWADFCFSMLVTMITAAISPVFYVIAQEREADLMAFSNHFMDQLMAHGVDYLRMWQSRSAVVLGVAAIVFLSLVQVDSSYLIHCIVEYLLAFWVVDKVNQFRDAIFLPVPLQVTREFYPPPTHRHLTKYDVVKIPAQNVRSLSRDTKIIEPLIPQTGVMLTKPEIQKLRSNMQEKKKNSGEKKRDIKKKMDVKGNSKKSGTAKIGGSMRRVMDDWVRLT